MGLPRVICLLPAMLCCPLTPESMYCILPPDFKNALVCSSIEADVSTGFDVFFLAGTRVFLAAIAFAYSFE